MIEFLRAAQAAPLEQLGAYARAADALPRVTVGETSVAGAVIGNQARILARQLIQVERAALPALRCALLMLSDVLAMELQARDAMRAEEVLQTHSSMCEAAVEALPQPYYLKD